MSTFGGNFLEFGKPNTIGRAQKCRVGRGFVRNHAGEPIFGGFRVQLSVKCRLHLPSTRDPQKIMPPWFVTPPTGFVTPPTGFVTPRFCYSGAPAKPAPLGIHNTVDCVKCIPNLVTKGPLGTFCAPNLGPRPRRSPSFAAA